MKSIEIINWIDNELQYKHPIRNSKFQEGYYHALEKLKKRIEYHKKNIEACKECGLKLKTETEVHWGIHKECEDAFIERKQNEK